MQHQRAAGAAPWCCMALLEERGLARLRGGPSELREIELEARTVEAQLGAGLLEALADHLGPDAGAGHAGAELGIVVLAAAHLAHTGHHTLGAVGHVLLEPL